MARSTTDEVEATLVISSPKAAEIGQAVEKIDAINSYWLAPRPVVTLEDSYWDLANMALSARRIALRLRHEDSRVLIALKGPEEADEHDVARRLEVEQPWSEEGFRFILARIAVEASVKVPEIIMTSYVAPPDLLRQLGFIPIQIRTTRRSPRDVFREKEQRPRPVAEMAVDTTTFHIGDADLVHREIEIEEKAQGGRDAATAIAAALIERFGASLRSWRYSKLATGKAIQALFHDGTLTDWIDLSGNLLPAAYDAIADYFHRRGE